MEYKELIQLIVSGCKFEYESYDHNLALKEYRESDVYKKDRIYLKNPQSYDMPEELKEKYKIIKIGKLREIHFAPNGKAWRFKIGNKYPKTFYIENFFKQVIPIHDKSHKINQNN